MLASEDSDDVSDEDLVISGMIHHSIPKYLTYTCDCEDSQGDIDTQRRIRRANRRLKKRMNNYVQSLLLKNEKLG